MYVYLKEYNANKQTKSSLIKLLASRVLYENTCL